MKVEVLDSIMGSGKTTGIIKWMVENPQYRYLYVSPMLSEVEVRIPTEAEALGFVSPNTEQHRTKSDHLLELLKSGTNVSFTHSLFQDMKREHLDFIKKQEYVLIIDEEIDFIEKYSGRYTTDDITSLETKGLVKVDEEDLGKVIWKWDDMESSTVYSKMKHLCDLGMLYASKRKREMLVLHLPEALLKASHRTIVLTYLFEGSIMEAFIKLKGGTVDKFTEISLMKTESDVKERARELITISDNRATKKLKETKGITLSTSWYESNGTLEGLGKIKSILNNLYKKHGKSSLLFTCKKSNASKRKPTGGLNGRTVSHTDVDIDEIFLHCGAKATNDYSHKNVLVHAYNRYCNVQVKSYLQDYGIPLKDDSVALSELVQWVWRSAIRNDEKIEVYFLSKRMENMFKDWLKE